MAHVERSASIGAGLCGFRQQLRLITSEYLDGVRHFVLDALAPRLVRRPQLEILDAVIRSVTVHMVYQFSLFERAAKMLGHYKPVFANIGLAIREVAQFRWHRHAPISVVKEPRPVGRAEPRSRLDLAMLYQAPVVCLAESICMGASFAVLDGTYLRGASVGQQDGFLHIAFA